MMSATSSISPKRIGRRRSRGMRLRRGSRRRHGVIPFEPHSKVDEDEQKIFYERLQKDLRNLLDDDDNNDLPKAEVSRRNELRLLDARIEALESRVQTITQALDHINRGILPSFCFSSFSSP